MSESHVHVHVAVADRGFGDPGTAIRVEADDHPTPGVGTAAVTP
jgi:hypothetical protein